MPHQPDLFSQRCLPVAFAVADMLTKAAEAGEVEGKKMWYQLRSLSQRAKATNREKDAIGRKIWAHTQSLLDQVCSPSKGPFTYALLEKLCKKFGYQCIVFSGLFPVPPFFSTRPM